MPTDTRSAVAEVIQKLSAEGGADAHVDTDSAPVQDDTPAVAEAAPPAADGDGSPLGDRSASERARDQQGRFAKAEKERKEAAAAAVDPAAPVVDPAKPVVDPALPELKPPQDWRAAAKEKFKTAPREVQEEAIRLYGETRKTLDRAAALEKEIEPWKQATAPYEHIFQRNGIPAAQAVGGLLRSFATLESGPAPARMQVAADIIRTYIGTDEAALTQLGQLLQAGGAAQPRAAAAPVGPDQVAELVRQQLASERAESGRTAAVKAWQEFEPTADLLNEDGVRADLADLAGKWSRENPNQVPSKEVFQKLYDRACSLNEKAAAIVTQRKAAAAAKAKQASTQSAAAGSGLKNEPAGPSGNGVGPAKDTREEVARQFKKAKQARV